MEKEKGCYKWRNSWKKTLFLKKKRLPGIRRNMNAFEVGKNIIIMSNELYLDVTLEMVEKEFRDTGQAQSMMFWGNCALAIEYQPVCQLHIMQNKWKNISKLAEYYIFEKKIITGLENIR